MSDQATNTALPFQERVVPWMNACFGPEISGDKLERGDRLLEEVFELLQSGDYPRERIRALEGYVYGRDKGEPAQEVGGVMVTLAAYCHAHAIDMHEAGETELARVWTRVDAIRAKQAAKPTGSALPVATGWPKPEYRWWAGLHEEHCDILDMATREDAIAEFRGQHGDDVGGYLWEAAQAPLHIADFLPASDTLLETIAENFLESEKCGEDEECPFVLSPIQEISLHEAIRAAVDKWQLDNQYLPTGWLFTHYRSEDTIEPLASAGGDA